MNLIKILFRIPFGVVACLFLLCFIPFFGMIFLPGGLLWILNGLSLLSPLVSWFIKIDDFMDMDYNERLKMFIMPLVFPFIFGYQVIKTGSFDGDEALRSYEELHA